MPEDIKAKIRGCEILNPLNLGTYMTLSCAWALMS